jgi:NADP-dependent 3-hydroxy acid dehydrogenase YdfG
MGQEGLHVIAAGRTVEALDGVVSVLGSEGAVASAFVADATKEADVEALFEYAQAVGPLSIAIYNAGNNRPGKIVEMEPEYFEATWRVGCFGGFLSVDKP